MLTGFPQPQIPQALLHDMVQLVASGGRDFSNGGQWAKGEETRIPFRGVILPVGNLTLQYAPAGTYTQDSRFLYTNAHALEVGGQVLNPPDGSRYTVKQELDHGTIHSLKRYHVERKGVAKAR